MAKKKPKGRRRRYLRGNVDETLELTTLASRTVASGNYDESVNERTLMTSHVAAWSLDDLTDAADVGPIMVGFAHGDYSGPEIEEFIENTGSWNEGDLVSQEIAKRKIKVVGTFGSPPGGAATGRAVLNDGKPIKTKCNWILNQNQGLELWAYNLGGAAIATTVPNLHVEGHANLWPTG